MAIDYAALLATATQEIGSTGGGLVQFIKDGDTTIKLVPVDATGRFFATYTSVFNGQPQQSALISCVILACDNEGVANKERIRYLKVPVTIVKKILNDIGKGWELLEAKSETYTITRGKTNGKTSYNGTVINRKFDFTGIELPEQTIDEAGAEQQAREFEKAGKVDSDGELI